MFAKRFFDVWAGLPCLALVLMVAGLVSGCGGGESSEPEEEVVVDEMQAVEDGHFLAWKLDPGMYKVEMTASGDGAVVKWVGSSCPGGEEATTYSVTCEMTQTGQLIVENPARSGGGATTVTMKVTKVGS